MIRRDNFDPVAESVPFDTDDNSFVSDNVQDAIEESLTVGGLSRFSIIYGYNGNSGTGRWLELFQNSASNTSPYVIAEPGIITSLSVSNQLSALGATFTVYVNGVAEATVDIGDGTGATDTGYVVLGTPIVLVAGDEISTQQTSTPSTRDPVFSVNIKVVA